mmetsp:Transcript_34628/g.39473  ORF Transcript_34628/g.39473 Transcript_34628/m.39473 type:complete len:329 (-) Transcript_34628:129-1115(-)
MMNLSHCSSSSNTSQISNKKSTHEEENSTSQKTEIEITVERDKEIQPHENDVLMGRGGKNNQHTGNGKLRTLARLESKYYRIASKNGKSCISRNLVKLVRCMSPPGRFLKKNNATGTWEDVGDDVAREKASQVLRDAISLLTHTSPDKDSQVKIDHKVDEKLDDVMDKVTQSAKRKYWEDFTCNEHSQHIVPNSVYPPHIPSSNHELPSKKLKYDTITWSERSSHMTYFSSIHYSNSADYIPTYPVTPRVYCQKTYPKYYAPSVPVSDELIQNYTATNESDLFNDEIVDSDGEAEDDKFDENDVVDIFNLDQSQISEGITAKIWPVSV